VIASPRRSPAAWLNGLDRVENQAGDVPCFVARPVGLGWGEPAADGVVKVVVVGDTDSPAVPAESGTKIGAGRGVVVRHVPEVEFEIGEAPHVPASRHGAGQVDGDRGPGCVPPGSDPAALMWCEVQDGAAWFLGDAGETRGLGQMLPTTHDQIESRASCRPAATLLDIVAFRPAYELVPVPATPAPERAMSGPRPTLS
jgi:hypothetical protein